MKKNYTINDMFRAYELGKHDGTIKDLNDLIKELEAQHEINNVVQRKRTK